MKYVIGTGTDQEVRTSQRLNCLKPPFLSNLSQYKEQGQKMRFLRGLSS